MNFGEDILQLPLDWPRQLLRSCDTSKPSKQGHIKAVGKPQGRHQIISSRDIDQNGRNGRSILETSFRRHPHGRDRHGRLQKGHGGLQIW